MATVDEHIEALELIRTTLAADGTITAELGTGAYIGPTPAPLGTGPVYITLDVIPRPDARPATVTRAAINVNVILRVWYDPATAGALASAKTVSARADTLIDGQELSDAAIVLAAARLSPEIGEDHNATPPLRYSGGTYRVTAYAA